MRAGRVLVVFLLSLVFRASGALGFPDGGTVTYSAAVPLTPTNSNRVIDVPQFNPSLGTLDSVELMLMGHVEGLARYESFNATSRQVTLNLSAKIELRDDQNNAISSILPLVSLTSTASPFDGVMDFDGTSGRSYPHLSADVMSPLVVYSDAFNLSRFSGLDQLHFPVIGTGMSNGTGPGNIVYQFSTATSAWVDVVYRFSLPEPAVAALIGVAFPLIRRKRS